MTLSDRMEPTFNMQTQLREGYPVFVPVCSWCGAVVPTGSQSQHREWHRALDKTLNRVFDPVKP